MPHPGDVEEKLGFDQIRKRLKSYCISSLGSTLVDQVAFTSDADAIRVLLNQNFEFVQIFSRGDSFPGSHYYDPVHVFAKAAIEGSYLETEDFLQVAFSINTIVSCINYLKKNQDSCPALFALAEPVQISSAFSKRILSLIDEHGNVKDSASSELARIRKKLREEQSKSRKLIDQAFRHALEKKWIPEGALPTIREGRLVIPVLAEFKRKLKGFILDESATGQTVFMEPAEVLESNNEIRDLEYAEKREEIKILTWLTDELRLEISDFEKAYHFLAWIDFTRAKAKLSLEIEANLPLVVNKPALRWMNAKHPLLFLSLKGKRDLVPLHIDLNETERMLLVSGPNAGGKSVCLKTTGLLQYMAQCGLLIPVSPDSTVGIFDALFIDIGDQQSIENDLSTYSSHLKNLAEFIRKGSENSLILMDELGSGTDPNFGGAIAQAVLLALLGKKVWGVATTHYYNLKLFAGEHPGIRNAAMRFDETQLKPLYILDIGKPGSSYALEIARKTGIPEETLMNAQTIAGSELVGLETLVRKLELERAELTQTIATLTKQDIELKTLLKKYEQLTADLESQKKLILNKAKDEARQLLAKTNREIEKTIRHIRENQAQKKETKKMRENLQAITEMLSQEVKEEGITQHPFKEGDRVRIIGQDGSGVVLALQGRSALVQLGELFSKIELSKLEKVNAGKIQETSTKARSSGLSLHDKRMGYSPVLDVRGKRVEEVIAVVDQFLDTSVLMSQAEIKIIHGKGEGVLRKVIREQLKKYKHVASFVDEHVDRGGDGITVVVLK